MIKQNKKINGDNNLNHEEVAEKDAKVYPVKLCHQFFLTETIKGDPYCLHNFIDYKKCKKDIERQGLRP
jgi:hypothetical protein